MSGEKTEQPTAKRLRDSREKGQVPKSQEVPSAMVVMSLGAYFMVRGADIMGILEQFAGTVLSISAGTWEEVFPLALGLAGNALLNILAPLVALVIVVSALSNLGQIGILISFKAATPKLENLSPAKWFKKTFSKNNVFELTKNIIKVTVLTVVVYKLLSSRWRDLYALPGGNIDTLGRVIGGTLMDLVITSASAFAVLAAIDFVYQRFKFTKDNMMSKDEVKREYKEMEGDPLIKSKRRQLQQEMSQQNSVGKVKKAKVLVTNPTHYAIALDYDQEKTPLPVVLAKGEGELARRMIEEARRCGIPVLREAPLARSLFEDCPENSYIPKDLMVPVAEVLKWAASLKSDGRNG